MNPKIKEAVVVGILGMFAVVAINALILIYFGYLPTITSFTWHRSDSEIVQHSYRIARNSFLISVASGAVLGFVLPKIFKTFRRKNGKNSG